MNTRLASKALKIALGALLISAAVFSSGCTALFAVAGAVVDTVCITSPLWGPSALENHKLDKIQEHVTLRDEDAKRDPSLFSRATTDSLAMDMIPIRVRFFEGKSGRTHSPYFSWLSAAPLVPYANVDSDVTSARNDGLPSGFSDLPYCQDSGSDTKPKTKKAAAKKDNPDKKASFIEQVRARNKELLQMASAKPSREELEYTFMNSQRKNPAFNMALLTREAMASQMPGRKVQLDAPVFDGTFSLSSYSYSTHVPLLADIADDDSGDDNLFSTSGGGENKTIYGESQGYREDRTPHIRITGKLSSLKMQKSQICYGLTLIGANLLSLFGAPLSTNQLTAQFDVAAYKMPEGKLIYEKRCEVETERKVVGVYYGGDFAADLNEELCLRIREAAGDFARELEPKLQDPRKTVQNDSPAASASLRRSL